MRAGVRWLVLLLFAACVPTPVYAVRRSALVPHPQPPIETGRAPDHEVRLSGYSATDVIAVKPVANAGANTGLYVARHNLGAKLDIRVLPRTWFSAIGQTSLLQGSMAVATDAAMRPDQGNANGGGFEIGHAFVLADHVQLGVVAGMMEFEIPYYEQLHCISLCDHAVLDYTKSDTEGVAIWSLALLPSYRDGSFTVFGGLTFRNHPTNTKLTTEDSYVMPYDADQNIREGPIYPIADFGVEWAANDYLRLLALVHQPLRSSLVSYGPAVAIAASIDLPTP